MQDANEQDRNPADGVSTRDPAVHPAVDMYGQRPKKPGMYLGLFHGRSDPRQAMDDWGFNGPAIGPLQWCHTTYATRIIVKFETHSDAKRYFGDNDAPCELSIDTDMVVFNGVFYGDWTIYHVGPADCERPVDTFRTVNRRNEFSGH